MSFRLLPVLILLCIAALGIRVADIVTRQQTIEEGLLAPKLRAQEADEKAGENADESSTPPDFQPPDISERLKAFEGKKAAEETLPETAQQSIDEKIQQLQSLKEEVEELIKQSKAQADLRIEDESAYGDTEIEILQRLSKRRQKLQEWERDLQLKENLLHVTETKISQRIVELTALQNEVEGLLAQYNEKEDAKIRSLVKIYENMKAKDAAKIFEELEMDVLLQVIDKMKEKKTAPILAKMSSERAKALTTHFAEQRRLKEVEQ